jgi:hypothetical protein
MAVPPVPPLGLTALSYLLLSIFKNSNSICSLQPTLCTSAVSEGEDVQTPAPSIRHNVMDPSSRLPDSSFLVLGKRELGTCPWAENSKIARVNY